MSQRHAYVHLAHCEAERKSVSGTMGGTFFDYCPVLQYRCVRLDMKGDEREERIFAGYEKRNETEGMGAVRLCVCHR